MSEVEDLHRRAGSMIMLGVVSEIDESAARVRVDFDGMRSDWIAWGERRAGPGVRTWSAPEVGEQVVVACPYGDPAQGVVVCSIYQDDHDAPADAATIYRTTYADGTVIEYDRAAHAFKVDVGSGSVTVNCATANITASGKATIDAPETEITGDLKVGGKIDAQGDITTPAEVKAGDIGLTTHKHPTAGSGPPSQPIP